MNSFHHQAVKDARAGAWSCPPAATGDGVVEGIEMPDRRFVVGVQWHPEAFWDRAPGFQPLFEALVHAAPMIARPSPSRPALARRPGHAAVGDPLGAAASTRRSRRRRRRSKPVMVDFWAEWCGWCHRLDKTTYVDPVVVKLASDFVAVKVNTEGGASRDGDRGPLRRRLAAHHRLPLPARPAASLRVNGFQGPGQFPRTMEKAREVAAPGHGLGERRSTRTRRTRAALAGLGVHLFEQDAYGESARPAPARAADVDAQAAARRAQADAPAARRHPEVGREVPGGGDGDQGGPDAVRRASTSTPSSSTSSARSTWPGAGATWPVRRCRRS